MGDLQLHCDPLPIEIGNYVWQDSDRDGVQDPCETPISNVTVSLYKSGVKIAEITTNANGEYYFSSQFKLGAGWTGIGADTILLPSTIYGLVFGQTQYASSQLSVGGQSYILTLANSTINNGNDQIDSDATKSVIGGGTYPTIVITTPSVGSDHTFNVGFYLFMCPSTVCTPVVLSRN